MGHSAPATVQHSIRDFLGNDSIVTEEIPANFIQFCWRSVGNKRGEVLYTDHEAAQQFNQNESNEPGFLQLGAVEENRIIGLVPSPSGRPVAAIDTSTIRLGDLADGSLCALRGAIVTLECKRYRYIRYGPLVFSLGNSRVDEIANLGIAAFSSISNVDFLLRMVRNSLERWLQLSVSGSLTRGLILFDGSLTAGTPDNPSNEMEKILEKARVNENLVIAISKNTQLRIDDRTITSLLNDNSEPCLLDVDESIKRHFPGYRIRLLGRVFVGKLARLGFPFRIDVDREVSTEASILGLRQLAGTDIVDQGYPETLRIAHILSTFTASDVLAIQSLAASRFGVQLVPKYVLRRSLFGPFGTGWETRH
jgi:hypothetical protein